MGLVTNSLKRSTFTSYTIEDRILLVLLERGKISKAELSQVIRGKGIQPQIRKALISLDMEGLIDGQILRVHSRPALVMHLTEKGTIKAKLLHT